MKRLLICVLALCLLAGCGAPAVPERQPLAPTAPSETPTQPAAPQPGEPGTEQPEQPGLSQPGSLQPGGAKQPAPDWLILVLVGIVSFGAAVTAAVLIMKKKR